MIKSKTMRRLISALSVVLIGVCIFYYQQKQYKQKVEARIAEVKKEVKEQDVSESDFTGIHIATTAEDEEDFRRFIQKPVFESKQLNADIDKFIKSVVKPFDHEVEKSIKEAGTDELPQQPSLSIQFDIYPFEENLYSVVFHMEEFNGGANAEAKNRVFLVDLENNEWIHPEKFIEEKQKKAIFEETKANLAGQKDLKDYFFADYFEESLNADHLLEHLYFTNEEAVFLFDKYAVAAGAAGTPEAHFPLEEFQKHLEPEFRVRLGYVDGPSDYGYIKGADRFDAIQKPKIITHNPEAGKKVAITFDDGPHAKNTAAIMDLLDKYHAKATFFMLGSSANFYPDLVARAIMSGHEIGEHSWSHRDFTTLGSAAIQEELSKTDAAIHKVTPWTPTLVRPPYGAYNDAVSQAVGNRHLVLWSIDTLDWQSHDPQAVLAHVKNELHDGAIILMHDVHDTTVPAVALVLEYLSSQGYEMVTVSELFE